MTAGKEADRLCRYLSGQAASEKLLERYEAGLKAIGCAMPEGSIRLWGIRAKGPLDSEQKEDSRKRLMLMAALLETDPDYNQLFRNSSSRLASTISFLSSGLIGLAKSGISYIAGR